MVGGFHWLKFRYFADSISPGLRVRIHGPVSFQAPNVQKQLPVSCTEIMKPRFPIASGWLLNEGSVSGGSLSESSRHVNALWGYLTCPLGIAEVQYCNV